MLIGALILAVAAGLLAGGKLKNLSYLQLRGAWLVLGALFLQAVLSWMAARGSGIGPRWVGPLLHVLSYVLLLAFTWVNRSLPGVRVLAAGVFLNGLVIALNGGLMPVAPWALPPGDIASLARGVGIHGLMSAGTRLTALADRFYLTLPGLGRWLFSVGDVLIDLGAFWLVFRSLRSFSSPGTTGKGISG
ncbi:Hypothetical protein DEACI_0148 [Acididesulfobacillus acetoxydans]|uniref:DUF5317 domain-containing protein n=1 Tax=Acididesulfobacillus acetoxydans TaxID=1561005 RepID=A0A8S0WDT2_9FIRM|nr:DUF5317 domain-containing protein [Acididesulfobacillus acetoxydans]CAA7599522.1 Hypothetical protein DEACI_0148 [Acididesulfobacillus acetoxydans]CEJ08691.1 Hypothetical protein DEACI_3170 [Acididesulfobacillus acetoxydans]